MKTDLFGTKKRKKRTYLEINLNKYDRDTFSDRLERLKYLNSIFPKGYGFLSGMETAYVFDEAKMTFINGEFISTIMLAQAFIEHKLQACLASKGLIKESKNGLKSMTMCLRRKKLVNEFLLNKIDHLRKIRNPFSHLRPGDESSVSERIFLEKQGPLLIMEKDAKNSIALMYQIAITKM